MALRTCSRYALECLREAFWNPLGDLQDPNWNFLGSQGPLVGLSGSLLSVFLVMNLRGVPFAHGARRFCSKNAFKNWPTENESQLIRKRARVAFPLLPLRVPTTFFLWGRRQWAQPSRIRHYCRGPSQNVIFRTLPRYHARTRESLS